MRAFSHTGDYVAGVFVGGRLKRGWRVTGFRDGAYVVSAP